MKAFSSQESRRKLQKPTRQLVDSAKCGAEAPRGINPAPQSPGFLPLVTAGQKPEFLTAADTLRALVSAAFQPTNVVFLPKEAEARVQARARTIVRLDDEQYGNHRLAWSVETPSPALIVVAQAYHPNWRAWVDGHPVELWRANYAYQALQVPAGQHRVEMKYQDRALLAGTVISALTLGLMLVGSGLREPGME